MTVKVMVIKTLLKQINWN